MNKELEKMKYDGYLDLIEAKQQKYEEEIDKQAKVIQWYEKENRHNQEIIIKQEKELNQKNKIIEKAIASIELGYVVFCEQDKECLINFRKNILEILKGEDNE